MFFEVYGFSKDDFLEYMEVYSDSFDHFFVSAKEMYENNEDLQQDQNADEDGYFTYIEEHFMEILAKINFDIFKKLSVEDLTLLDAFLYEILHLKHPVTAGMVLGTLIQSLSDAAKWYFDEDYVNRIASEEMRSEMEAALDSFYKQTIAEDLQVYEDFGMSVHAFHEMLGEKDGQIRAEYEQYAQRMQRVKTHFSDIQSGTLDFLVHPHTPEEKIEKIRQYQEIIKGIGQGVCYTGNKKIYLVNSEELYQQLRKKAISNDLDAYFDHDALSLDPHIQSVPHLFICFHAFRLDRTAYSRDRFIEAMRWFIDHNFKHAAYQASEGDLKSKYREFAQDDLDWMEHIKFCYYKIYDFYLQYEKNMKVLNQENKLKDMKSSQLILSEKYSASIEYYHKQYGIEKYYSYEINQYKVIQRYVTGREKDEISRKINERNKECQQLLFDHDSLDACKRMAVSVEAITLLKEALTIMMKEEEGLSSREISALKDMRDNLANIIFDIIGIIYFNRGMYQDLKQEKKQDLATIYHDENDLKRLKIWRSMYEGALKAAVHEDINELMKLRLHFVQMFESNNMPEEEVERVISEIIAEIRKKAENQPEYSEIYALTQKYLEQYAGILTRDIIMTIASAEYLYNRYILAMPEMKEFDYSCISILYYQALENAYNHLLYKPYVQNVIQLNLDDIVYRMNSDRRNPRDTRGKGYLPDYVLSQLIKYDKENRTYYAEPSCMFGPFTRLMDFFAKNPNGIWMLRDFLLKKFNVRAIDEEKMRDFVAGLWEAGKYRNNAAHGGRIIDYHEVKRDKSYVYEKRNIENFKLLLNKLLQFFTV